MALAAYRPRKSVPCEKIDWRRFRTEQGSKYLKSVSDFVDVHLDQCFTLKNPPGSILRIAPLQSTIYKDKPDEVNEWGKFYLPDQMNMEVLGVVEGISCPSDELVLMTCEDKKLYAYDGEELHEVGHDLEQLENVGIEYPSDVTYYNGQAFENMTKEDWEEVKMGDVGQKLEEEHKKLVEKYKSTFLENLKSQK